MGQKTALRFGNKAPQSTPPSAMSEYVSEIERSDTPGGRRLPGYADFWRLWLIGLIVFTVRWVEMLVFAVFAYQVTGSALVVTKLTMLRMLPLALFGHSWRGLRPG